MAVVLLADVIHIGRGIVSLCCFGPVLPDKFTQLLQRELTCFRIGHTNLSPDPAFFGKHAFPFGIQREEFRFCGPFSGIAVERVMRADSAEKFCHAVIGLKGAESLIEFFQLRVVIGVADMNAALIDHRFEPDVPAADFQFRISRNHGRFFIEDMNICLFFEVFIDPVKSSAGISSCDYKIIVDGTDDPFFALKFGEVNLLRCGESGLSDVDCSVFLSKSFSVTITGTKPVALPI